MADLRPSLRCTGAAALAIDRASDRNSTDRLLLAAQDAGAITVLHGHGLADRFPA